MNDIPQRENSETALRFLAAQRQAYRKAKRRQAWQFGLLVPVTTAFTLLALWNPAMKPFVALYGLSMTLLDLITLNLSVRSLRKDGARLQEAFDCQVLQLPWNQLRAGARPDAETVEEYCADFRSRDGDVSSLRDWYPPSIGRVSLEFARVICQRQNCWWDAKLRRRYSAVAIGLPAVATAFAFAVSLAGGLTLEKFVLVVLAPMLPIWALGLRQFFEHKEAAEGATKLKEFAERLWEKALLANAGPDLAESRALQDSIFDHRKSSPLVFDWVYRVLRVPFESQANRAGEEAVARLLSISENEVSLPAEEITDALSVLRRRGYEIGETHLPTKVVSSNLRVWINGQARSLSEILLMAKQEKEKPTVEGGGPAPARE